MNVASGISALRLALTSLLVGILLLQGSNTCAAEQVSSAEVERARTSDANKDEPKAAYVVSDEAESSQASDSLFGGGEPSELAVKVTPPPLTRYYVNLDALGWWLRGEHRNTELTTNLLGNHGIRPGGRVQGGIWIGAEQTWAIEGHYYGIASESTTVAAPASIYHARVRTDPNPPPSFGLGVVGPNPPVGLVYARETSQIQSAGGVVREAVNLPESPATFYVLRGYRFFQFNESITVESRTAGSQSMRYVDDFATNNTFNGGEIGLGMQLGSRRWTWEAETRLAMGNMHQTLTLEGLNSSQFSNGRSFPNGYLVSGNAGTFHHDSFSLIPQIDLKLGFQVRPALRLTVGYNFTAVTQVIRPGDQIDINVVSYNTQTPGILHWVEHPIRFDTTSIWLQGITAGLEYQF